MLFCYLKGVGMKLKFTLMASCLILGAFSLNSCEKVKAVYNEKIKKKKKQASATDFKIECPGQNSKCSSSQVTVTNISQKEFGNLVVVCKDKKNPDAPPDKPYYTFPFSLYPDDVKCVDAVDNCMRERVKDINTGEMINSYVTLLQLNSDNKPIWKQYQDCK